MLKIRVIPTLLWKNVGLVKGISFDSWRGIGTVMPAIKVYNTRDVDELILLDVAATSENRTPDYNAVEELAAECFVPFTVGGGVRDIETIQKLLRSGADKISINTAAYYQEGLIKNAAKRFGSQCVVGSIDAKRNDKGEYECFSHNGTKATGIKLDDWAKILEQDGAGEILITSIDNDGTMNGYDIEMIGIVSNNVSVPVIASGGAGSYEDMFLAIHNGNAAAVAAASIFHFTEQTPAEAKNYLATKGVPVRNVNAH